ncbi:MAG: hypothetical protein WCT06_08375, partial [Armatimonadota bacterium]
MALGDGYTDRLLSEEEMSAIVERAVGGAELNGKRVLMVIPDHSRTAPVPFMFKTLYGLLADKCSALDVLVALGTHPPMEMDHIYQRVGITEAEHKT